MIRLRCLELVQVRLYGEVYLDFVGISIGSTLEVAKSPALNAAFELAWLLSDLPLFGPHSETAVLFVAQATTRGALTDVALCALTGLVADLVTLEAQLFVAVKGVV